MTIKDWLKEKRLIYGASENFLSLDAELILCYVLSDAGELDRSYLVLHDNEELLPGQKAQADKLLAAHVEQEIPLAYVLKQKEFYGRKFYVDERVLIPRPETEEMISCVKNLVAQIASESKNTNTKPDSSADSEGAGDKVNSGGKLEIIDVGTGSSCIATTLKLEIPAARVTGLDISTDALKVASKNARHLQADVKFLKSDLLSAEKELFTTSESTKIVVANLPYVDKNWDWTSKSLRFEPKQALFAEDGGLKEIKRLIEQVATLKVNCLVLEADPSQHDKIIEFAKKHDLKHTATTDFILTFSH